MSNSLIGSWVIRVERGAMGEPGLKVRVDGSVRSLRHVDLNLLELSQDWVFLFHLDFSNVGFCEMNSISLLPWSLTKDIKR